MFTVTPTKWIRIMTPLFLADEQVPTVMLWGPPGVGKSEAVHKLAEVLSEKSGNKTFVHDVRLLLFNPIDLRGIPVPDPNHEFSKWLKPQIFNLDSSPKVRHILFLDELTSAMPSVQAAAYQLVLNRRIGEHELPNNVIIIAAGNRVQDKGVAYKMPTPLANRMSHFEIESTLEDWKEWASQSAANIHDMVLAFLSFRPDFLNKFDPTRDESAFPTPRSWAFVSRYLRIFDDLEAAYPMIASVIGKGTAAEFKTYCKTFMELPDIDEIVNGKVIAVDQKRKDLLYALSISLVTRTRSCTQEQLGHILNYILGNQMPKEFVIFTMRDICRNEPIMFKLMAYKRFSEWYTKNEALLK